MKARDERRLRALQKHLNNVKLLIVDELGYVPFTAVGSELLLDVFSQRQLAHFVVAIDRWCVLRKAPAADRQAEQTIEIGNTKPFGNQTNSTLSPMIHQ
jgi:hypothetical protein